MAHPRQEFTLGAARAFRRLLRTGCLGDRLLQLAVGVGEIDGALLDLLLQELPVSLQPRIALPDLVEHLVEAVDPGADLVLRAALDAQGVVLLRRHPAHGLGEIDDGAGNLLLQPRREPERAAKRRRDRRRGHP